MSAVAQQLFHLICTRDHDRAPDHHEAVFRHRYRSMPTFVARFGGRLDFAGKTVLDVGSGLGGPAFFLAERGAGRVLGVDIVARDIQFARAKLAGEFAALADRVSFTQIRDLDDLGDATFDLIVSRDSFEHYADPAAILAAMLRHLAPGGRLAIGFGPLWKSPYGGHITYMTRLPWAHLLFPERVILRERRHFFPDQEASAFGEIVGGLNQMTLARFNALIAQHQLKPISCRTNVSVHPLGRLFTLAGRLPFAREYVTFNLYGIWRLGTDSTPGAE